MNYGYKGLSVFSKFSCVLIIPFCLFSFSAFGLTAADQSAIDSSFKTYQQSHSFEELLDKTKIHLSRQTYAFLVEKTRKLDAWPKLKLEANDLFTIQQGDATLRLKIKSVENGEFEISGKRLVVPDDESPGLTWNHITALLTKHHTASAKQFLILPVAFADDDENRLSADQAVVALTLHVIKNAQGINICQTILENSDQCTERRQAAQVSNKQNSALAKAADPGAKSSVDEDNFAINDPVNVNPKTHRNANKDKMVRSLGGKTKILQDFMSKDAAKSCPYYAEGLDCINHNLNDAAQGLQQTPVQLPGGATTGGISH